MNKEDDAIKKFVNDHKNLLTANKIDVAQYEIENTWFVYRYEKQYGYYDYFIRFSTVAQLVDIILNELKFELYIAIGKEIAPPEGDENRLADMVAAYYKNKEVIPELTALMDIIINTEIGKKSDFFQVLDELIAKSNE